MTQNAEKGALYEIMRQASYLRRWILTLLGYVDGDRLVDLFPGTGVLGKVAAQGRLSGV